MAGYWRHLAKHLLGAGCVLVGVTALVNPVQAQVSAGCTAVQAVGTVNVSDTVGNTVSFGPFGPFDEGFHEQPADGDTIQVSIGGRDIDMTVTFQGASNDVQTLQAGGQRFATLVIGGPTFPEDQNVTINVRTDRVGAGAQARVTLSCLGTPNPGQDPVDGGGAGGGNDNAADTAAAAETNVQSAENAVRLPTTAPGLGSTFTAADKLVTPDPSFRDPERIRQAEENEAAFRKQFGEFRQGIQDAIRERVQADANAAFNKVIGKILGGFRPSLADVQLENFTNGEFTEIQQLRRDDNGRVVRDADGKPVFLDVVPPRKLTPAEARAAREAFAALSDFADTAFADRVRDFKLRGTREGAQITRIDERRDNLLKRGEGVVRRLTELGADDDDVQQFVSGNVLVAQTLADNFTRQLLGFDRAADALSDGNARTAVNAVLDAMAITDGFDFTSDAKARFGAFNARTLPEDLANEAQAAQNRADDLDDIGLTEGEAVLFTPHGRNGITFGLDTDSLSRLMAAASGNPDGASRSFLDRRFKLWMKGRIAALNGNANGADGATGELLLGGVYRVTDRLEIGALGGYFMSDLTADSTNTDSETRSGKFGLYSNILFGNGLVLGVSGTYERGETDTDRAGVTADFGYNAYDFSGSLSGSVLLGKWLLSPSGALTLSARDTEGHTDSAGTVIAGRREADVIGTGSLGLSRTFRVKREWLRSVTPSAVVTGNYFLTSRNTQDFDHLDFNVGGGVTLGVGARSSLSLNLAAGGFGQNTRSYSGQIRFSMPF